MDHISSFRNLFEKNLNEACLSYKYKMDNKIHEYLVDIFVNDFLNSMNRKPTEILDTFILSGELPKTKGTLISLKMNGDYYLSVAGYTPEALIKETSNFEHTLDIGKYSYYRLFQRLPTEYLFKTLSHDYMQLIFILNQVFDTMRTDNNETHIVKMVDSWNKTRHSIFRKRLARVGVNATLAISC